MNNVISFKKPSTTRTAKAASSRTGTVVSLTDWCRKARPHRTPTGVFFISHAFGRPTPAT